MTSGSKAIGYLYCDVLDTFFKMGMKQALGVSLAMVPGF